MAIVVTNEPDPMFPGREFPKGEWQVRDDGICYNRYATKEEADAGAVTLGTDHRIGDTVEAGMDVLRERLESDFGMTNIEARQRMKEYLDFE